MRSRSVDSPALEAAVDPTELVGPGRYPLRIQPAAALEPGRADSRRLMVVWFVRKSFYWLFFLGFASGTLTTAIRHEESEVDVDWLSPDSVTDGLLSPWAGMILAFIVRFVVGWIALGLAYPLAVAHEPNLSPRDNFGSGIGTFFDRLHIARAFRSLRWTHHVRQVALKRLGPTGRRIGKLDPVLDVVNIASGVVAFVIIFAVAFTTSS